LGKGIGGEVRQKASLKHRPPRYAPQYRPVVPFMEMVYFYLSAPHPDIMHLSEAIWKKFPVAGTKKMRWKKLALTGQKRQT
jgi:hypothetical protein